MSLVSGQIALFLLFSSVIPGAHGSKTPGNAMNLSVQMLNIDFFALFAETGDFLNCEGSGLFLLQSSCKHRLKDSSKPSLDPCSDLHFHHQFKHMSHEHK